MSAITKAIFAGSLIAAVLPVMAGSGSEAQELIDVTLPTQVTPNIVVTIARIGAPLTISTRAGDTLRRLVAEACGAIDPIYFRLAIDANPPGTFAGVATGPAAGLPDFDAVLPAGKSVVLPACAPPPAPAPRTFSEGDALSKLLPPALTPTEPFVPSTVLASVNEAISSAATTASESISVPLPNKFRLQSQQAARDLNALVLAPPQARVWDSPPENLPDELLPRQPSGGSVAPPRAPATIGKVEVPTVAGNNVRIDPNYIPEGRTWLVPSQVPVTRSIALKSGISVEEGLNLLREAGAYDRIASVDALAIQGQVAEVPIPASGPDANCKSPGDANHWPIPVAAILDQLRQNTIERAKFPKNHASASILVLDTGFDFRGFPPGYPSTHLPAQRSLPVSTSVGISVEPAFNTDGFNFATHRNSAATARPYVVAGLDLRWHGAAVISAALGTRAFDAWRTEQTPQIIAASAVDSRVSQPFMTAAAIDPAVAYARRYRINVLNYSAFVEKASGIDDAIRNTLDGPVIVAAAGNASKDVGGIGPARLGGDTGNAPGDATVITVGGHEPGGSIWAKANYSRDRVDLLAPACGIPVYEGFIDGATQKLRPVPTVVAGTSFAAPIVSFAAGLLASEHVSSPRQIKERLNISVRLHKDAWRTTYSGGILDIPTALSLYYDVLRYKDESGAEVVEYGKLTSDAQTATICGDSFLLGKLQKFAVLQDGDQRRVRYWWRDDANAEVASTPIRRGSSCTIEDVSFTLDLVLKDDPNTIRSIKASDVLDYVRRYFY